MKSYSDVDMQGLEIHNCPSIPKKTSKLENDSDFITGADLAMMVNQTIESLFDGLSDQVSVFYPLSDSDGNYISDDSGLPISCRIVYNKA